MSHDRCTNIASFPLSTPQLVFRTYANTRSSYPHINVATHTYSHIHRQVKIGKSYTCTCTQTKGIIHVSIDMKMLFNVAVLAGIVVAVPRPLAGTPHPPGVEEQVVAVAEL